MASIFSKVRALALGNIHDLLDKAIDLNSPAVVRQYVRDLGEAKEQLADEAAAQKRHEADLKAMEQEKAKVAKGGSDAAGSAPAPLKNKKPPEFFTAKPPVSTP